MRFLQSIVRDAQRPLTTGTARVQRSPTAGESPAPPLEEAEDGAMTLYRFQKEGATNPRQVAEAQPVSGAPGAGSQGLPLSPSRPKPVQGGQTLTFNDVSLNDSVFEHIAVSGNDRVLTRQTESTLSSADASESAVSTHASGTHDDLSRKLSETNQVPDLSDPSVDRETVRTDGREFDKSRRRETGAATPSENPPPAAALGGRASAQPAPEDTTTSDPAADHRTTHRPPPTQNNATLPPVEAEVTHQAETFQAADPQSESEEAHTPAGRTGPRVSIGQLDVMVVKTPRTERPAKTTPSRHFLSRNYLRRL